MKSPVFTMSPTQQSKILSMPSSLGMEAQYWAAVQELRFSYHNRDIE